MSTRYNSRVAAFHLGLVGLLSLATPNTVNAQVQLDGSLGPATALTGPDYQVTADLGQTVGGNLYHSFTRFDIAAAESATFSGPANITNIMSRITGGSASQIDGLLRSTIVGANLYLINPNGVVFGPSAALDISGSFAVTTADVLHLDGGGRFDASNPGDSVLTAAAPAAFGFLNPNPAPLSVEGATLQVDAGQVISIVASDTTIGSGLVAPGGRVNLVAVHSPGQVTLDAADPGSAIDLPGITALGDVQVTDGRIDVDGDRGGRIVIRGGQVLLEDTELTARTHGDQPGRGVRIDATGQVALVRSRIDTRTDATANAGQVHIVAETILLDARNAAGEVGVFTQSTGIPVAPGADVIVSLDIAHTFVSDVSAVLESPEGTRVLLFAAVGGGGHNFVDTTIDDLAATPIGSANAPFTGSFQPQQPLANFAGEAADGDWILELDDSFIPFDDGQLLGWELSVNGMNSSSTDVGQVFDGTAIVRSTLTVDTGGQSVNGTTGFAPGFAGSIDIHASSLVVLGNPTLSATANLGGAGGVINVDAPTLTANGFPAGFVADAVGGGEFEFVLNGSVITDGSLGPIVDLTGSDVLITSDLGELAGNNLFHSFSEFSLAAGQTATFSGPATVQTILARVTGGNPSTLDGTVRSDIDGANLMLINPAGVLTSSQGSIDVSGSVALTTASRVWLGADGVFTASLVPGDTTLTGSPPIAFEFSMPQPRPITIDGTGIGVAPGLAISIIGGEVQVTNGGLSAPGGRINLIGVGSPGRVLLDPFDLDAVVDTTPGTMMGDITTTGGSELFASGPGGGQVTLRAYDLMMTDTRVFADTEGPLAGRGVDIGVISDMTLIRSEFDSRSYGAGDAGDIRVVAGGDVLLDSRGVDSSSGLYASTRSLAPGGGHGGVVTVEADSVTLLAGSKMSVSTFGTGPGGSMFIFANNVTVDHQRAPGNTTIAANSNPNASGDGGQIFMSVLESLAILEGGEIGASANHTGDGGTITIFSDSMVLDGRGFNEFTGLTARAGGAGDGGSIDVSVNDLQVLDGSSFSLSSTGSGDAGTLQIDASSILLDAQGSTIFTGFVSQTQESGQAGDITITANTFEARAGGLVSVRTIGSGNSGAIDLEVGALILDGLGASSNQFTGLLAETRSSGMSGEIRVRADSIDIRRGAQITTSTLGTGAGGPMDIFARTIYIDAMGHALQTGILGQTLPEAAARGGDMRVEATEQIEITGGGVISTSSLGAGAGSAIDLITADLVIRDNGGIFAIARDLGDGGSIHITAGRVTLDGPDAEISARAFARDIADLAVTLNITHAFDADLLAGIASPSGILVILFNGVGGSGDNFINTVIDDRAAQAFSEGAPPFTGRFRPSGAVGNLSDFLGEPANGTWMLLLRDTFPALDDGVLNAWSLTIGSQVFDSTDVGQVIDGSSIIRSSLIVDAGPGATVQSDPLTIPQGGRGGDVSVHAAERVSITNEASISAGTFGPGDGGNVSVTAPSVRLDHGGLIETASTGLGDAGSVTIEAANSVWIGHAAAISTASLFTDGDDLSVTAGYLIHASGGRITAEAGANGGNISLVSGGNIALNNAAVTAQSAANGGDIKVTAPNQVSLTNSLLSAEAGNDGGNISIDPVSVVLIDSQIIANAILGNGGNITIVTDVFLLNNTPITADSPLGTPGQIEITSPDADLAGSLATLPDAALGSQTDVAEACAARLHGNRSSFVVVGRGGLPLEPGGRSASGRHVKRDKPSESGADPSADTPQ